MKNLLRISIISIILCTLISIPVLAKTGKVVNTEEVRFREKALATEDSKVLGKVKKDTTVEILEEITGWYKVEYDGKIGYINSAYLEIVSDQQNTQTKPEEAKPEETKNESKTENESETNNNSQPEKPSDVTTPETNTNNQATQNNVGTIYKTNEKVSVRLMPLINSNIISTLEKDVDCTIIAQAGNWSYIESSTVKGWIISTTITDGGTQSTNATVQSTSSNKSTTSKKGYVNTEQINVRKTPNTSSELVQKLQLNTEVTIIGEEGDWYKVELNGKEAYIYKPLISDSKK